MSTTENHQQSKTTSYTIGSSLTGQNNWAVWKATALAYMKRCQFMKVDKQANGSVSTTVLDEDGAFITYNFDELQ